MALQTQGSVLTENDFRTVYSKLYEVRGSWFEIGIQLGLTHSKLMAIQKSSGFTKPHEWFREMLNHKITMGGLTWQIIVDALEDITVDQREKANEIRQLFLKEGNGTAEFTVTRSSTDQLDNITEDSELSEIPPIDLYQDTPQRGASMLIKPEKPGSPVSSAVGSDSVLFAWEEVSSSAEGASSSAGLGKKRPSSVNNTPTAKQTKHCEYVDERVFIKKSSLDKYRCLHCSKVPTDFYRCIICTKEVSGSDESARKWRYSDNQGLSCPACKHNLCKTCETSYIYERDSQTNQNLKKLAIACPEGCGATVKWNRVKKHIESECSKRSQKCKYSVIGCSVEGDSEMISEHERKASSEHLELALEAIVGIRKTNEELVKTVGEMQVQILQLSEYQ